MEKENLTKKDIELINEELSRAYSELRLGAPEGLTRAEEYSLNAGGKRIRPRLTLEFCRMFGGDINAALPYAVAVEMVHTASLIHDDLPSIDNDELRRGKPTSHMVFGEAAAILAGDGLFMDAFLKIADNRLLPDKTNIAAVREFALDVGSCGLVGGEYIDVMAAGKLIDKEELRKMCSMKTGALIRAAAVLGALAGGVMPNEDRMADVITYSENIGLAFQVVDDILDRLGDTATLGKNTGMDEKNGKTTYLSFMSEKSAKEYVLELTGLAIAAVSRYESSERLIQMAKELAERIN